MVETRTQARQFRKKPVVIEAIRWMGDNASEIADFMLPRSFDIKDCPGTKLFIETLEGVMCADEGDWIIRGIKGELYPCKPDIFEATYEEVSRG